MSSLVSALKKIKYVMIFIVLAISFRAATVWLFDNYTMKNLISLIIAYSFLVGAGNWGVIGYSARTKYWKESQTYFDSVTLLVSGIGFITTIVLFVMFVYTHHNNLITELTWGAGALTLGGILRL